jgi:hypothetical protein
MSACAVYLSACVLLGPSVPTPSGDATYAQTAPARYSGYARAAEAPANELLFRREAARAQQRAARIEVRKWQGNSALRPVYRAAPAVLFDPFPGTYPIWGSAPPRVSFNFPIW